MASIQPFPALRPQANLAARVCELPYDVVSSQEARALAEHNPLSFFHVSKPEVDLPPNTDLCAPEVYAAGRRNFDRLMAEGVLWMEPAPCFYLYRQVMSNHSQTGLVAAASCEEYLQGSVRKHELTRPDKEEDRLRHIEALNAQTGPVFLVYPALAVMDELVAALTAQPPDVDFVASDNVRHTAWTVREPASIRAVSEAFAGLPRLYIADGHHRCAAAARLFQRRRGAGQSGRFLAVLFPHNQVQILPYNRVLKDLNGLSAGALRQKLESAFDITLNGRSRPAARHALSLFLDGQWYSLKFRTEFTASLDPIERLDVTLLQKHVLGPIFGIEDPRTSKRLDFVGGIRGPAELERLVGQGQFACAFSLFPTSVEDLMRIAEAGGLMPPKSTWFEPKLRDALFCHMI